ncbi:MAG: C40 family peptidase [Pseudonocardiales bacterium]
MRSPVRRRRLMAAVILTLCGVVLIAPAAIADPRNPTDAEIAQSQQAVKDRAAEVGRITAALVKAQADVAAAAARAEAAAEAYNKARVDEQVAARSATAAARSATAAQAQLLQMIARMDKVAASNYMNAGGLGPLTAVAISDTPADVLHDAGLLSVMSGRQQDGLNELDKARTRRTNALSTARAALLKQAAARRTAERAKHAAEQAQADSQRIAGQFTAQKADLQHKLVQAQARAGMLIAARQAAVARARAEAAARAAAARAAAAARRAASRASTGSRAPSGHHRVSGGNAAAIAVNAALSQVGKPYVWGAAGPDAYDCSGLMLWSYAHAGIYLPHFSGYQYQSGSHIPLSALIPGDLVFYSFDGAPSGIHHVAMYIGGGAIVEAPTEGIPVRVRSMYYSGILPLGTRPY